MLLVCVCVLIHAVLHANNRGRAAGQWDSILYELNRDFFSVLFSVEKL